MHDHNNNSSSQKSIGKTACETVGLVGGAVAGALVSNSLFKSSCDHTEKEPDLITGPAVIVVGTVAGAYAGQKAAGELYDRLAGEKKP